eukprot:11334750-Alexandrium_andersonii.AAC.1
MPSGLLTQAPLEGPSGPWAPGPVWPGATNRSLGAAPIQISLAPLRMAGPRLLCQRRWGPQPPSRAQLRNLLPPRRVAGPSAAPPS